MMTDKELIRRALMGNREAQELCTEKEIAIPCPFCQCGAIVEYDAVAPFEYDVVCGDCGVMLGVSEDKKAAIKAWNTRPAPPVGRCKDCKSYTALGHCKVHSQEPDQHDTGAYVEIIEHGKIYKVFTRTYCGCVFAVCEKDVYWDESLDFACVECPECEEKMAANKQTQ